MKLKHEWKSILGIVVVFLFLYYLPVGVSRFDNSILEALYLLKWYAREHVLLCLVPAMFIAGGISIFLKQTAVLKYLGPDANKVLAYGIASVSGTILAVCSCTVLPLFTGIYKMGAGLGPATAFLYSGPAINILAIILTAKVLGFHLGVFRAIGAIFLGIIVGILMHIIFYKEEKKARIQNDKKSLNFSNTSDNLHEDRTLFQNILYFMSMIGILVFANWAKPATADSVWLLFFNYKWFLTLVCFVLLMLSLGMWFKLSWFKIFLVLLGVLISIVLFFNEPLIPFTIGFIVLSIVISTDKGEVSSWFFASWELAKQIIPLLFIGVFIAGILLGRVGHEGLIPSSWIINIVGGNSLLANFVASFIGAFMYFATLTEVPILQGLISNGMGQGPALALLLAGPALSLPNMLIIGSVLGVKKTIVFVSIIIVVSTIAGFVFGNLYGGVYA